MSDNFNALLTRARNVFELARKLGCGFREVANERVVLFDQSIWPRFAPLYEALYEQVAALRDEISEPPTGFAPVAEELRAAGLIARDMREHITDCQNDPGSGNGHEFANSLGAEKPGAVDFKAYATFYHRLLSVAESGLRSVDEASVEWQTSQLDFLVKPERELSPPTDDSDVPTKENSVPVSSSNTDTDFMISNSIDYRSVKWFGRHFTFTANQAIVVKILVEHCRKETPDVAGHTLLLAIDSVAPPEKMSTLFRDHPAWKTMIVPGATKGAYRISGDKPSSNS